jgi:Uma2 family endonuclease
MVCWSPEETTMALTTAPLAAPAVPGTKRRATRAKRRAPGNDIPDVPIYRLTVAQYHAMAKAGILGEDEPVELLEGWLVRKMTKYPPHTLATRLTRRAVEGILPPGWFVDSQEPVTTSESEPEPDVLVVRGDLRDFGERHPGPEEVALLVEVADSSLQYDRGTKKRIYARARIPVYWIVNLIERQVEVYTEPSGPRKRPDYRRHVNYGEAEEVPVLLDGVEVAHVPVRELLP